MKPKFSKQFDMASARAGAPISQADGDAVEILKWDVEGEHPIVGIAANSNRHTSWRTKVAQWSADGKAMVLCEDSAIVMLPLGDIDGKPVFVGDELVTPGGNIWIVEPTHRGFTHLKWPAPAKIYPRSQMADSEILDALEVTDEGAAFQKKTVARARPALDVAIRHAIDAGQVVPAEQHARAVRALERAGFQDLGGEEWVPPVGLAPKLIAVSDPKRDLAASEAVRNACRDKFKSGNLAVLEITAYGRISGINLNAIIAEVAP